MSSCCIQYKRNTVSKEHVHKKRDALHEPTPSSTNKHQHAAHLHAAFGRMSMLKICLPVHISAGLSTAGVGRSMCTLASLISQTSWLTSARDRTMSLLVSRNDAVRKSCDDRALVNGQR